jgi:membrane protease YdiL (CAAX protease family)
LGRGFDDLSNAEIVMSETANRKSSIGAWQALLLFVLIWAVAMIVGPALRSLVQPYVSVKTPRDIVAFRMGFGLPISWLVLGGTILILRLRGQRLSDIGWGKPGRIRGWLLAAVLVAFFVFSSFGGRSCRGMCFIDPHMWLTDWSPFRTTTSIAIGLTAGICEETMFRGFVMTQARDGGAPVWVQIVLAGVLFGLAHFGIGGFSGHFNLAGMLSAVVSTTIFGALFAIVYLLAGRSLTPGIIGHGLFAFSTEPWMLLHVVSIGGGH